MEKTVGLFGTCGNSSWRNLAIEYLEEDGVDYFNPVVENYDDAAQQNEVYHFKNDAVIMLVITEETSGIISMAESGWMALATLLSERQRFFILVAKEMPDTEENRQINKCRRLIEKYCKALDSDRVFCYPSISLATMKAIELIKGMEE